MTYTNGLPLKPRIPTYFHIVPMSGDRIQLKSAHKTVILSGKSIKAAGRLLELLDGTREVPQILQEFPDIPEEEVLRTMKRLFEKGLVEEAAVSEEDLSSKSGLNYEAQVTFFSVIHRDGRSAQDILRKSRIAVFGLGRVGSHAVASLARAGIGYIVAVDDGVVDGSLPVCGGLYFPEDVGRLRTEAAEERLAQLNPGVRFEVAYVQNNEIAQIAEIIRNTSLVLVCQDSPAVNIYRSVNEASLQQNIRWLRASLEGFEAQLGPCVIPQQSACFTCYELRTKGNWSYYDENLAFEQYLASGGPKADYGCLASMSGFLGNMAALECLKLLTGFALPITCGKLWTFNINTFEAQAHEVLKLPRCPSCGFTVKTPNAALWSL